MCVFRKFRRIYRIFCRICKIELVHKEKNNISLEIKLNQLVHTIVWIMNGSNTGRNSIALTTRHWTLNLNLHERTRLKSRALQEDVPLILTTMNKKALKVTWTKLMGRLRMVKLVIKSSQLDLQGHFIYHPIYACVRTGNCGWSCSLG